MVDIETAKRLFLEGLRLLEANNLPAAEISFARSLELVPDRVSILNNLSAVKIKLGKFTEAEACARKAVTLEAESPEAWLNLAIALQATERLPEALQAYDRTLTYKPANPMAWLNKAIILLELKKYEAALLACEQALKLDSSKSEILYTQSLILKELQRSDEAKKVYWKSLQARADTLPLFMAARRPSQKADVLVINQNPTMDASLTSFEALQRPNYPGQLADHLKEDFHFTYVFCGDVTGCLARKQIPPPGMVINNVANGELVLTGGNLSGMNAMFDGFGVPVVNHPTKVVQTTRDASAKLVEDITGIVVPKTRRFSAAGKSKAALVDEIQDQFEYPLITRTLFSQMGKGMTKVESREDLIAVISSGLPENFFVTQFVDCRAGNPFYRKIRAAFVGDEIVIVRVDYDAYWNVRGRKTEKRVQFYLENAHLLNEEKRLCRDPEAGLGRTACQALRAISDRIPLEVFGMDFDVDADGRLIFYEANATMNLFSTARREVPNPKEAEAGLKMAFQRYFTSLVDRR